MPFHGIYGILDTISGREGFWVEFQIEEWVNQYVAVVEKAFEQRIWLIGLQGSWGRGEATSHSDIDMVLILDTVSYEDLQIYRQLLDTLPYRDKICGFVSGRAEIEKWDKSDLFQFCNDTVPIVGSLEALLKDIRREHVIQAVKSGVCGIYHGCVHNAVHERSVSILQGLYKSAVFPMRGMVYLEKGVFIKRKDALLPYLTPEDQEVLRQDILLKEQNIIEENLFDASSKLLIQWASRWIQKDLH